MPNQVFKELFNGKYDSMTPTILLPQGWIQDGKNVRKVSKAGGWKARKGCSLHNTTVLGSGAAVKSLHWYLNPKQNDVHFIAQCNSKLYASPSEPPTGAAGSAWTDLGVTAGATPGFSCVVDEWLFYADGTSAPIAWGGDNPFPVGFFVYDDSVGEYIDYTRVIKDGRSDTEATAVGAAADYFVVISPVRIDGIVLDLGSSVNSNAVDIDVEAMRSGTFTNVSDTSDGTQTGGDTTLAQDGTISWTASSSDTRMTIGNVQGFAYKVGWSGALSGSVTIKSCKIVADAAVMENRWSGEFQYPAGFRYYDQDEGQYVEALGKLTNESTSQYIDISEGTTSDFIYIKTVEPAAGFGFGVVDGYENGADAQIDLVEYWDGTDWADSTTETDTTLDGDADSSFAQSGQVWVDLGKEHTPVRRVFEGDEYPGYWYRVSWDDTLDTDVRLYVCVYAALPEELPAYDGCVNFKGRLFLWGDPEFPNRLRYSTKASPFAFSGSDSRYTDAFGDAKKILCAIPFYNELIVFKEDSIWLLEGDNPNNFGTLKISDTIGLASPKSALVIETGYPTAHRDEPLSVALWQEVDGTYILDGRKPKKISDPVDRYFNPEYTECIGASDIRSLQAYADPNNNEYHLLTPSDGELVYNYVTDEWYPPWERKIVATTGLWFRGKSSGSYPRKYTYGASAAGWVMRLETDTADKTVANADEPIEHYIKTRALTGKDIGIDYEFLLKHLWATFKSQSAGSITCSYFKDQASTGVSMSTPTSPTLVNSGYNLVTERLDEREDWMSCVAFKFLLDTIDQEMEIYQIMYEINKRSLLDYD